MMKFYTIEEVAALLGVAYHRVYHPTVTGRIPRPQKVGRTWLFTKSDVDRLAAYLTAKRNRCSVTETPLPPYKSMTPEERRALYENDMRCLAEIDNDNGGDPNLSDAINDG